MFDLNILQDYVNKKSLVKFAVKTGIFLLYSGITKCQTKYSFVIDRPDRWKPCLQFMFTTPYGL